MHWGIRRYQNEDGTLTAAGRRRLEKNDTKWARKNGDKITSNAKNAVSEELHDYAANLVTQPWAINRNGKLSAAAVNSYNKKMAELMSEKVSEITAPSGKVVQFVAKRGSVGVYMALATPGYDMSQIKNGVWDSGRVAYKKTVLNKM